MENRRQTTATKPFSPRKYYDKNRENAPNRFGKYPPREGGDNRFQHRENNDRYQKRENGGDRFQKREGGDRFQRRDSGDRFQNREGNDRYQNREGGDRYQNRHNGGDRFQPREARGRFQPRGGGDRFQSRDNREGRDNFRRDNGKPYSKGYNKFQPKKRFPTKGKTFKPWQKEDKIKIVSDMQVTDGKHKGKYLQSTTSPKIRPTARRIREIMFRILYRRIRAGRFLDLCAGSGTVGIEAISRGAMISTFVERSSKMCSYIKKNLEACGIKEGHGEIVEMEVMPFLKKMAKRRRLWDVVYFDPPYDSNYEEILELFSRGTAVKPGGVLVVEHHAEMFFPEKTGVLKRWRVIVQGDTAISFYERK